MSGGGKNRIMIYGPKDDGTYAVEFRTVEGDVLAVSIPRSETHLVRQPCGCPVPATTIDGGLSSVGGTARPSAVAVLRLRTGATRGPGGP
jgi:hypothetical protein